MQSLKEFAYSFDFCLLMDYRWKNQRVAKKNTQFITVFNAWACYTSFHSEHPEWLKELYFCWKYVFDCQKLFVLSPISAGDKTRIMRQLGEKLERVIEKNENQDICSESKWHFLLFNFSQVISASYLVLVLDWMGDIGKTTLHSTIHGLSGFTAL